MAQTKRLAVVFHFDGNFGLNYKDTPDRRKRTVNKLDWWRRRKNILCQYVLPALDNQAERNFDVWGLFMRGYEKLGKPIVDLFQRRKYHISWDGPSPLRAYYRDSTNWLGVIHHDSDDLYSGAAFKLFAAVLPEAGRVAYAHKGFVYSWTGDKLHYFGHDSSPPLSFHMMWYTNAALQSEPHWYGYRRLYGLDVDHFKVSTIKNSVKIADGNFCQLIHGTNTVSAWKNPNVQKRLADLVGDQREKRKILARFGVRV